MTLTPTMKAEVERLLEQISDRLACNGCNDWDCPSTEVAMEIFNAIDKDNDRLPPLGKTIYDFDVLALVKKALGL